MTGPIGLHGGGEYLPGDERFLDALLEAAAARTARRAPVGGGSDRAGSGPEGGLDVAGHSLESPDRLARHRATARLRPLRVVIVPTAAARGRPDVAAATGRAAFEGRAAAGAGRPTAEARDGAGGSAEPSLPVEVRVEVARIVDPASAADPDQIERLLTADLIHFPGGDPDLIPEILGRSPAREAIEAAWRSGAVLAGASAGAMALAEWTWTPHGGIRGLGFVSGLAVVPHYDDIRRTRWQSALDDVAPGRIGYLGLDERTGVIGDANGPTGRSWRVAGEGAAHWFARGATEPITARHGDVLPLPG